VATVMNIMYDTFTKVVTGIVIIIGLLFIILVGILEYHKSKEFAEKCAVAKGTVIRTSTARICIPSEIIIKLKD
jgi:hypothetical protein